jgi:hypothetical protein
VAGDLYNYTAKAPVDSAVSWTDGLGVKHVLALPVAAGGTFNRQPELQRITKANCQALTVTAKRVEIGEDPICTLRFGTLSMPLLGLRTNRRWEAAASVSGYYFRSDLDVPADGVIAALTTGYLGFEVVADAVSKAAYIDTYGLSTDITQSNFSGFDAAATPNNFAVGGNGALKFGQNLWSKSVSIEVPVTYTSLYQLGNLPSTSISLKVRTALVNLEVYEWVFDSVSINTQGDINFSAAESELQFFVEGNYTVRLYNKLAPC